MACSGFNSVRAISLLLREDLNHGTQAHNHGSHIGYDLMLQGSNLLLEFRLFKLFPQEIRSP